MNATTIPLRAAVKETRMRPLDIVLAPGSAGSRITRWTGAGIFGVMGAGALATGIAMPDARGQLLALFVYAFGIGCLWMLWLSALLLVARDGRHLCMPGVARNAAAATCLYALAGVGAPAVVAAAFGGNVSLAVLISALAIAACLAFAWLPRMLAIWMSLVPALYIGLHNTLHVPSPLDPRFQHWAWLALAVLVAADVIRWRQLLRGRGDADCGWRSTMILQMRHGFVTKDWGIDRQWGWRRSANSRTDVDFRGLGRATPMRAIQVALGGWYVPQTLRSRLGSLARVLFPVLLFVPLMMLMSAGHGRTMQVLWRITGISAGLWIGLFGGAMLALGIAALVQRRWKHQASMALLTLLPGIGVERGWSPVLRAIFTGPAIGFVVLWLCMLGSTLLLRMDPWALLMATLFEAAMVALMVMAVLRAMTARPLGIVAMVILGVILIALTDASFVLAASTQASQWDAALHLEGLAVLAWLAFIGWATWQAVKHWRALRRRPHPFLANPS